MTPREMIARVLDLLVEDLQPTLQRALQQHYGDRWLDIARQSFRDDRSLAPPGSAIRWDAQSLLTILWDQWPQLFRDRCGPFERSLISELREFRNRWAHQHEFDFDDTYRCLDTVDRVLRLFDGPHRQEVAAMKRDLLRMECERLSDTGVEAPAGNRRMVVLVYVICCLAIIVQGLLLWGPKAWFFAAFVALTFGFLTWQHLRRPTITAGPRECPRCGRIIYSRDCPYCSARPTAGTT
ncbi:MAG: hypothetical protein D6725_05170 [Planctomycetota bacterium]|nr:MAG: hypothetical protein D6725_05170 [Planctomycetota bacterium]